VAGKKAITPLAREMFSAPTSTVYVWAEFGAAAAGIARLVNKKDSITIKLNIGNLFINFLL
jgi:hypothetical protein